MSVFTPKSLNFQIKCIQYHIGANTILPHEKPHVLLELARSKFAFFKQDEIDAIVRGILLAHFHLSLDQKEDALRMLTSVREKIVQPKVIEGMMISNRLLAHDNMLAHEKWGGRDIGTLWVLPDIALYRIKEELRFV